MIHPRARLVPLAALLLIGCSDPPVETAGWDEQVALLRVCPRGDSPWRPALQQAMDEERLEELLALLTDLSALHADRWEPEWAAAESLYRLHRPADAGPRYEASLGRARALSDDTGIACNANRLGWLSHQAGGIAEARTLYDEALAASLAVERVDLASFVRNNLAGLLLETGDFLRATTVLEEAAAGLRSLGYEGPALVAEFNRAVLLLELGDAVAARERLEAIRGDALQAADPDIPHASAVLLGNLHLVLDEDDEAVGWFEQVGGEDAQLRALAKLGLARVAVRRGDPAEGARLFAEAAVEAGDEYRADALLADTFGADALLRAGDAAGAEARLRTLLDGADTAQVAESLWAAHWILGRVLLQAGRTAAAIESLERALASLEEQAGALDPMTDGMRFLKERADPYVDLARAELQKRGAGGAAGPILAISARAKARALRRALGGGADPAAAAGLAVLQGGLADGEILVDYLVGEDGGVALAVTKRAARAAPIAGRRTLAPQVAALRAALRDGTDDDASAALRSGTGNTGRAGAALRNETTDAGGIGTVLRNETPDATGAGAELRRELLDPFDDLLEQSARLYVVPDRDLALLPFAALPGRNGGGFVGDRLDIASLPLAAPPPRWTGEHSPVLVAGQPELSGSGFADLPWSAYEASRLREVWGEDDSSYLGGGAFTLEGLQSVGVERFRTLHLSTHALASTRDPRRSGIILSGGQRLGLQEILDLPLGSPLVVLSACRTGEGEMVPGEGVLGLTWAFLQAGARGIVATHWTVEDAAAARLMVAFHRRLHDGVEPMAALAGARRELVASGAAPGLWAPFFLVLRPANAPPR